ncbi:efflux RND transporter periplasmic adaptor subunit [Methylobacterium sp. WSM2598]|uniref:efflux RND transporter periplasmic adaptor subunit n=1 Tax=Methylobacterium sp. WSM2598 TaxID=398261 RepID=UPI001EFFDB8E|nr:efflux RND transporter periplasmic adaptor subunit [Methylobacterium sp. WSM2598]
MARCLLAKIVGYAISEVRTCRRQILLSEWRDMIKSLGLLLTLIIAALALWFAVRPNFSERTPYISAPVRRGNIAQTIAASGSIEPVRIVSVGAQVSGRVVALHVRVGQQIARGQIIAEIDSLPQMNDLQRSEAALNALRAQRDRAGVMLHQAELAFHRQREIAAGKAGARADYEAAEAAYGSAQADLATLDAQIEGAAVSVRSARTNLAYTRITAPIDGTVVAIVTKEGQTVIASQTAPTIIRLADLGTMSVKARISEADIGRVRPGMRVRFTTLAQPERLYETILQAVDPAPDQIAVETNGAGQALGSASAANENPAISFNARLAVANEDGALKPLMTALVSIVLDEARDAVLVPAAAVTRAGAQQGRLRILNPNGRPEERRVRTGLANGVEIQILDGVAPGEAVIVAGPEDGARFAASRDRAR